MLTRIAGCLPKLLTGLGHLQLVVVDCSVVYTWIEYGDNLTKYKIDLGDKQSYTMVVTASQAGVDYNFAAIQMSDSQMQMGYILNTYSWHYEFILCSKSCTT